MKPPAIAWSCWRLASLVATLASLTFSTLAAQPDLRLVLTDSPDPVSLGELLTCKVTVTNAGTVSATDASVVFNLASNATFFSASLSQGSYSQGAGAVTCSLGTLPAQSAATVNVVVTPTALGTLTQSAVVTAAEADANPADNSATASTLAVPLTLYPGPTMLAARRYHTATTLLDGRILFAGGRGATGALNTAELYDPQLKAFLPTGNLTRPTAGHTATRLQDGTVLLAGGFEDGRAAQIYNPTNGTFTSVSNMLYGHAWHSSTLLADGRVLIAGGTLDWSSAELYLPHLRGFVDAGRRITGSFTHCGFLLTNGTVALLGGSWYNDMTPTNDIYVPGAGVFVPTPFGNPPHKMPGAAELLDGTILMAGGMLYSLPTARAVIFDPATTNLTEIPPMNYPHPWATANRLQDGQVFFTGTDYLFVLSETALRTPELYNPATRRFSPTAPLLQGRQNHTATLLSDGSVLIAGGYFAIPWGASGYLASTEIYDPARTKVPPGIAIANAAVLEGDSGTTNLLFPLTLSSPMGWPVTVKFSVGGDGTDFQPTNGTVTF
ncbi:MAG TPA: kelch repeat-containing protein, partial [Bacillota bacterium]|nr:kelch repeat-containing protein [Bacillota bacterium]